MSTTACVTVPPSRRPPSPASADSTTQPTGVYAQAITSLSFSLDTNIDGIDPSSDVGPPDLHTGTGYGVSVGYARDGVGFGALVLASEHDVRGASSTADFEAGFLEGRFIQHSTYGGLVITTRLGVGIGVASLDFERGAPFEDARGPMGEARFDVGVLFGGVVGLEAGAGYFTSLNLDDLGDGWQIYIGLTASL